MPDYSKYQTIGIVTVVVLILGGIAFQLFRPGAADVPRGPVKLIHPDGKSSETAANPEPDESRTISVHVAGKVARAGIYELAPGSRVQDAVDAAGGESDGADLETINLAQKLQDGQQVYIAPKGQTPPPAVSTVSGGQSVTVVKASGSSGGGSGIQKYKSPGDGTVSINTAGPEDLQHLPGVGPAMAQRIIDYRKEHGGFQSVDELEEVKGIGPKTLAKMKPFVKL